VAKLKAPLLSMDARGSIGKSVVFGNWRGVNYARQHIVPSNPKTAAQTITRGVFASLQQLFKRLGTLASAPWGAAAQGQAFTDRNSFTKNNLQVLRGEADMQKFIASPGVKGGLPPTSIAAVGGAGAGEIDITVGTPAEPTGFTLVSVDAVALVDRDPGDLPTDFPVEGQDAAPTAGSDSDITLSGLSSGEDYVVCAWTKWLRPDGRYAYGASLVTTATAT